MRGYLGYKNVWNPHISEDYLKYQQERGNENDEFAIGVYQNDKMKEKIVGHIRLYLSKAMFKFPQLLQSKLLFTVKGKRVNRGAGFGLEISIKYTLYGLEKVLSWIQEKIKKKRIISITWKRNASNEILYFSPCTLIRSKLQGEISFCAKTIFH